MNRRNLDYVKPKKGLGQHFLRDLSVASRIADTLDGHKDLPTLEIGPGTGVLTQFLLEKGLDLRVVELDGESVVYLANHYPQLQGRILPADFLQLDLATLYDGPFTVIGNYPYNISSQIFFKVLEYKDQIPCCSGMIQREVAQRICGAPGTKAYGIISVLLQAWYDTEYLFTVDEHVFDPPPKVKSAVIRMTRNSRTSLDCDERLFKTVVKTAFNQRRKMLRSSLRALFPKDAPCLQEPLFTRRPEQLSVVEFEALTNIVSEYIKTN